MMFQINNALIFGKFLNLFGHGTTFCDAEFSYKKEAKKIHVFRYEFHYYHFQSIDLDSIDLRKNKIRHYT